MGDADYLYAFQRVIMPIAYEFAPDLVIGARRVHSLALTRAVSAGFDAAAGDPLGECQVTPAGFAHMTHQLSSLAGGKLVLALEGGYDLPAISNSAVECIRVLLGDDPPAIGPLACQDAAADAVEASVRALSPYWKSLRPTSEHLAGAPSSKGSG